MYPRILSAVVGVLLLGSGLALAATSYTQVFDVAPATPQPARPSLDWDVTVHSDVLGGNWAMLAGSPMDASHGADCGAPPATHHVATYDDAVFFCKNHIMTALFADGGYGMIYLTPNQMVDFSTGEAVIRWDMSTLRTSARDWVDLWVSPYADHLQMPLEIWLPDLQGPPRNAVHIRMDNGPLGTVFRGYVHTNFDVTTQVLSNDWGGYDQFLTPDAARRDTFELILSRTHVKFWMPGYNRVFIDGDVPDLGWEQGVVQFGHHSYNPLKECDPAYFACTPNTWHWDNVTLSSAIPFSIGKVTPRAISDVPSGVLTFDAPAPPGAVLQFAAVGANPQVSWDGGTTWANTPAAAEQRHLVGIFENYQVPVPEGATAADLRLPNSAQARDFSIWSQITAHPPTRTPTPLPLTPTATPAPPTATVTPLPTATPGPTMTPLPSPTLPPTATPVPNPTATPVPGAMCQLTSIINGVLVNTPLAPVSCPQ